MPPDAPAPEPLPPLPAGPGTDPPPPAPPPPTPPLPARLASFLARRSLGPRALSVLGVVLASLAAFSFSVSHPGLGGLLGLAGVLLGRLAALPVADGAADGQARPHAVASALSPALDLLLLGAIAARAGGISTAHAVLCLTLLALHAWLPHLEATARGAGLAPGAGLWHRDVRIVLVLLGCLLGRPLAAALLVLSVALVDAWHRLARLAAPGHPSRAGPSFLGPLLDEAGALQGAIRWGSLAIAVLLLALLPREGGWRL